MSGKKEKPLKSIVKGIISKLKKRSNSAEISAGWKNAVGEDAAGHTKLVSFKKGRLIVKVSDSSRLYGLTLTKKKIIEELNKNIEKKIKDIRFRIGQI